MTIKTPRAIIKTVAANRKEKQYDKMIKASQAKLAETILVTGYTNVYA